VWCPDFAKEFGEAATSGVREIAKGATLGDAAETIRKSFAQLAKTFSESFGRSGAENAVLGMVFAHWNQTYVKLKGDESATSGRTQRISPHVPLT
jgi:hypothetical protein